MLSRWMHAIGWLSPIRLFRRRLRRSRVVLFGGLSGAGKSTICKGFADQASIIELDGILLKGYDDLSIGEKGGDPYSYDTWQRFLEAPHAFNRAVDFFYREVTSQLSAEHYFLMIIVSNHFVVDQILQLVIEVLQRVGVKELYKVALEVPATEILQQRQRRGNPYDRKMTLEGIQQESLAQREKLTDQDFNLLNSTESGAFLKRLMELDAS